MAAMPSICCFCPIKKCAHKVSFESYCWPLKPENSHSFTIFSSTIHLREVILHCSSVDFKNPVSTSAYERLKIYLILVEKLPGPQFGVHV